MHPECELSIITINYNGLKDTCALIETIPFNDKMEVIVVDNASKKDEAKEIEKKFPYITIIKSNNNLGYAGGNNLGIRAAHGKYLFIINNDTIFKDFNVQALIDRFESAPNYGIVCPKIRFVCDNNPIQYAGYTPLSKVTVRNRAIGFGEEDNGQYNSAHLTPYAHGAAMLVKREAIEKIGLMPECYFLYYEELDWSMMFTRAGYQIWYEPACTIYHKESQATGQNSPLRTYYITRNRFLLVRRNYPFIYKWLAYSYLLCMVLPKDVIKHALTGRWDLAKATLQGVKAFMFNVQCTMCN